MRKKKEFNVQIGERVRWYREKAGLTQERFSEMLDISTNHVSEIERGISGMSVETLKNICSVLCISADQILMVGRPANDVSCMVERLERLEPVYFDKLVGIINCYIEAVGIKSRT